MAHEHPPSRFRAAAQLIGAWVGLGSLWACAGVWPELSAPMVTLGQEGVAGLVSPPQVDGPEIWFGDARGSQLLAVDQWGRRALVTDGYRVAVWDRTRLGLERVFSAAGGITTRGVFSEDGALALVVERQSDMQPELERLRVLDLATGQALMEAPLPCGCLVDFGFGERSRTIRAVLSSEALGGTWVVSWSWEGAARGQRRVTDATIRTGEREAVLVDAGEAVAWVEAPRVEPGGEEGQDGRVVVSGLEGEGELVARAEATLPALGLGERCDEDAPRPCGYAWALEPGGGFALAAAEQAGGGVRLARVSLEEGASAEAPPVWTDRRAGFAPARFVRRTQDQYILVARSSAEPHPLQDGPALLRVDAAAGVVEGDAARPPGLLAGPARLGGAGEGGELAAWWREVLGLPTVRRRHTFAGVEPRLFVDARTGTVHLWSRDGYWRLAERAEFLGTVTGTTPLRLFEADYPLEVPHLRGVVTSFGIALERVHDEDGLRRRGVGGPRELYGWSPPFGLLVDATPLPGGELAALVGSATSTSHLLLLKPPVTPSESWITQRRLWEPDGTRALALTSTGDGVAALRLVARGAPGERRGVVEALTLDALTLTPRASRTLEFEDEGGAAGADLSPGVDEAAAWSRAELRLFDLNRPDAPPLAWRPGPEGWIKAAHPLGAGRVAIRLADRLRPSDERWIVLDLAMTPPRVLGHRRLQGVVALAPWIEGRELLLLEGRGVLTRLSYGGDALRVLSRAVLSTDSGTFVQIDADGALAVSRAGADHSTASTWLREGLILPLLLEPDGRVAPGSPRLLRPGALLTW